MVLWFFIVFPLGFLGGKRFSLFAQVFLDGSAPRWVFPSDLDVLMFGRGSLVLHQGYYHLLFFTSSKLLSDLELVAGPLPKASRSVQPILALVHFASQPLWFNRYLLSLRQLSMCLMWWCDVPSQNMFRKNLLGNHTSCA